MSDSFLGTLKSLILFLGTRIPRIVAREKIHYYGMNDKLNRLEGDNPPFFYWVLLG